MDKPLEPLLVISPSRFHFGHLRPKHHHLQGIYFNVTNGFCHECVELIWTHACPLPGSKPLIYRLAVMRR